MADLRYVPKVRELKDAVYFPCESDPMLCDRIIGEILEPNLAPVVREEMLQKTEKKKKTKEGDAD